MDIFAAFMFSGMVLRSIEREFGSASMAHKKIVGINIRASFVGLSLLALIYTGMGFVAGRHSEILKGVSSEQMLSTLTIHILGDYAGVMGCLAVSLACLTTAISLSCVFAEFM